MENGWDTGQIYQIRKCRDQHLGRVLSGLNPLSIDFSLTPPFFDTKAEHEMDEIDQFIRSQIANSEYISESTFNFVRYLFASLCFHHDFLKTVLQPISLH